MNNENGVTLKDITSERFCIPLYQRLFAWTPKEVTKLLRDLKEHFESDRFKKEHNPYYLGMLTTIQRDGHIDLIDGQQLIRENKDGSCIFQISVVINFELYSVLMSYGPGVRVISPRCAVSYMKDKTKEMADIYEEPFHFEEGDN